MAQHISDTQPQAQNKPSFFSLLVRRLLVFILGFIVAFGIGESLHSNTAAVVAYIGFICLFPRGDWRKAVWWLPVGFGLLMTVVALALGVPPDAALFLGGAESWLLRILQNRGRLSWDWVGAPLLLLRVDSLSFGRSMVLTLSSFGVVFALGVVAQVIYGRVRAEQIHEEMLTTCLARLKMINLGLVRPENLIPQIKMLTAHVASYATLVKGKIREAIPTIVRLEKTVNAVVSYCESAKPSTSSGWSKGLLRSQTFGQKNDASAVVDQIHAVNALLTQAIRTLRGGQTGDEWESILFGFEEQAALLVQKTAHLPDNITRFVESIAQTTLEIVKNMREDPQDRTPGQKFLDRYLPAVHKIIDEYQRLSQGPIQGEIQKTLDKSAALLERLDQAFREELGSLLQNDAMDFAADIDTIDVMLQMKGH